MELVEGVNMVRVHVGPLLASGLVAPREMYNFRVVRAPPHVSSREVDETYELTIGALLAAGGSISTALDQSGHKLDDLIDEDLKWNALNDRVVDIEDNVERTSKTFAARIKKANTVKEFHELEKRREVAQLVLDERYDDLFRDSENQEVIRSRYNRKVRRRQFAKLFRYVIFLSLITAVGIYQATSFSRSPFYLHRQLEASFSKDDFQLRGTGGGGEGTFKTFEDTDFSYEDVWGWLKGPLLDVLYPERVPVFWDQAGDQPLDGTVGSFSTLLGRPRLRQLRSTVADCDSKFEERRRTGPTVNGTRPRNRCFGDSTDLTQEPFELSRDGKSLSYRWLSSAETGGVRVWGYTDVLPGSGYVQDLPFPVSNVTDEDPRAAALALVQDLEDLDWVDARTRALFVEFSMANQHENHFVTAQLLLEFPTGGGIFPTSDFNVAKLVPRNTPRDTVFFWLEVALYVAAFFHLMSECFQLKEAGLDYFKSFYNWLDISIFALLGGIAALQVLAAREEDDTPWELTTAYLEVQFLNRLAYWRTVLYSLLVFVAWIKLFDYLAVFRGLNLLIIMIEMMMSKLWNFGIVFCLVVAAFTSSELVAYGYRHRHSQSWIYGFLTRLMGVMAGETLFNDHQSQDRVLGTFYQLTFLVVTSIMLLNLLIAILTASMDEAKQRSGKEQAKRMFEDLGHSANSDSELKLAPGYRASLPKRFVLGALGKGSRFMETVDGWLYAFVSSTSRLLRFHWKRRRCCCRSGSSNLDEEDEY